MCNLKFGKKIPNEIKEKAFIKLKDGFGKVKWKKMHKVGSIKTCRVGDYRIVNVFGGSIVGTVILLDRKDLNKFLNNIK